MQKQKLDDQRPSGEDSKDYHPNIHLQLSEQAFQWKLEIVIPNQDLIFILLLLNSHLNQAVAIVQYIQLLFSWKWK